jgi:acyl-coenzyme A synthetase/AMP-(fatty) acid ligase
MSAESPRNMSDYEAVRRSFQWERPERFKFALDVIDRHAAERPDALALLWSDEAGQERRFTFSQLKQQSVHAAQFLLSLGMQRGDRVFILMPRVPEWWFIVLGCIRAGIVFMPGTPMLTPKDIRYRLSVSDAQGVITDVSCLDRFEGLVGASGVENWVAVGEAPAPWIRYEPGSGTGVHGLTFERTRADDPMLIYYLNDEAANQACRRGDWYVTGDRAVKDADGYFWFVGRADDVIKTSGYRVGPFEVESALLEHEAVAESAVIGVPDERIGQRIKAYVVLAPGHKGSPELAMELQEHVKRTTAPYKYPREIEFVTELPKTVSGKIRRAELRGTLKPS